MEIYLIGHGGVLEADGYFDVPQGIVVHFYCPHTKKFDSSWEPVVRQGGAVAHPDFAHERVTGRCRNYRLAHPGGIKSTVRYVVLEPLIAPHYVGQHFNDQANFAVKDRSEGKYYVHLKDVLESIKPRNGMNVHVHWLACRDALEGIENDFSNEARGMYGGVYVPK